jgi:hypothetical protein
MVRIPAWSAGESKDECGGRQHRIRNADCTIMNMYIDYQKQVTFMYIRVHYVRRKSW